MLSAVLVAALSTVSGGLLSETPVHARHARFIDSPLEFAGGLVAGARRLPAKPIDLMSLDELRYARAAEEENAPSIVGPIVIASIGAALLTTAVILMAAVVVPAFSTTITTSTLLAAYLGLIGFAVAGIAGTVLLIIGLVKLGKAFSGAAKSRQRINDIDARIEQLQASPQPPGPPLPEPTHDAGPDEPPPPPPPEQGFNTRIYPGVVLATF